MTEQFLLARANHMLNQFSGLVWNQLSRAVLAKLKSTFRSRVSQSRVDLVSLGLAS